MMKNSPQALLFLVLLVFFTNGLFSQKWYEELKEKDRKVLEGESIHVLIHQVPEDFQERFQGILEKEWKGFDYVIEHKDVEELNVPFLGFEIERTTYNTLEKDSYRISMGVYYFPAEDEVNSVASIQLDPLVFLPQEALMTLAISHLKANMNDLLGVGIEEVSMQERTLYLSENDFFMDMAEVKTLYDGEVKVVSDEELFELMVNPQESVLIGVAERSGRTRKEYMQYIKENPNAGTGHMRMIYDPASGSTIYKDDRPWNSKSLPGFAKKDFKALGKL